ncbi:nucleotidyltransferase family protein [Halothiobacillus sp.]|uniref:nucleotidyltransferase family protein n=1 Tax=Halothiobacillus sp. TaxID=1891311 RepID=UPI002AD2CAFA|nr:nucleotidyltransferase family protein [Halothiobacillus sp.]
MTLPRRTPKCEPPDIEPGIEPVGILLAAGFSRRFGVQDKRHLPWNNCHCLAEASALPLIETLAHVVVVVRPEDEALAERLAHLGCEPLICPHAEQGMGASLAWGVRYLSDHRHGWVVGLADMPAIAAASVAAVRQALIDGCPAARPAHAGQPGHPVGFSVRARAALLALKGDMGARALFTQLGGRLLPTDDAGFLLDIDEPAALR